MSILDIILLCIIAAAFVSALVKTIKRAKKGECCGNCSSCSHCKKY
ncbi:MAG: FeoB-associated Cys-rich membrane protein [Clostridia bacterium]|nr:FeoB-associated Cys-rich membrane protein [Clostridia bacterium]